MKRLFIAVTVCTLAIAAAASTKANSRVIETGYTPDSFGTCTQISSFDCNGTGTTCKDGSGAQLYRFDNAQACSITLAKP